jgi:hypothetical protein
VNVRIGLKNGKQFTIKEVTDFKDFREFANQVADLKGFAIFNTVSIKVSEIEFMEEVKGE